MSTQLPGTEVPPSHSDELIEACAELPTAAPTVVIESQVDADDSSALPTRKASKELITIDEAIRRQSRHKGHIVRINYQQRTGLLQSKEWPDELLPFHLDAIKVAKDDPKRKPALHDPCDFKLSQISANLAAAGCAATASIAPATTTGAPPLAPPTDSLQDSRSFISTRFQATSLRLKHRTIQAPIGGTSVIGGAQGGTTAAGISPSADGSYDPLVSPTPSSFSSFGMMTPSSFGSYTAWAPMHATGTSGAGSSLVSP